VWLFRLSGVGSDADAFGYPPDFHGHLCGLLYIASPGIIVSRIASERIERASQRMTRVCRMALSTERVNAVVLPIVWGSAAYTAPFASRMSLDCSDLATSRVHEGSAYLPKEANNAVCMTSLAFLVSRLEIAAEEVS
jgi:hypothetical protein